MGAAQTKAQIKNWAVFKASEVEFASFFHWHSTGNIQYEPKTSKEQHKEINYTVLSIALTHYTRLYLSRFPQAGECNAYL